jgi:molecular chaperone DnaJ
MLFAKPCGHCGGSGVVSRERCPDCAGAGRKSESQTVSVEIPPGVADGDKISLAGLGGQGRASGRPGDLYVHIHVQKHPFFTRKGDNLFCTVPVTFTEAALGAKIEVPTPDGGVTLRVPAGVQSGQKLRLSERGAPSRRSAGRRGDLFVVIQVVTPKVYDDRSRELLRELDRLNPVEPRAELGERSPEVSS